MQRQQATAEQHSAAEQHAANVASAAPRKRQRTTPASLRPQARSPSGKEYEADRHGTLASQPAAANVTDPGAENILTMSELGLTSELLGAGREGYVFKVRVCALHAMAPRP